MRDEEKQIEEMAKDIYATGVAIDGTDIAYGVHDNDDHFHRMAIKLYKIGYRKQSDTARDFVKRLKELLHKYEHRSQTDGVSFYQMIAESFCDEINEIAEQYGVEEKQ